MQFKTWWENLPKMTIAIEIFSIVFAVLLALGMNEYREYRNQQALAEKALENIVSEIQINQAHLQTMIPNHKQTLGK